MEKLTANFWNDKYISEDTKWNIGYASYPITAYFDQLTDKAYKILVPGAGNAYEVEYLYNNQFRNVYLVDWSQRAINNFQERMLNFPESQAICQDYFEHEGNYDIIVEQTFFCALTPNERPKYVEKAASLLNKGGKLVGVLFNKLFEKEGPPFGGTKEDYIKLFEPYFEIQVLDNAYNSIDSRISNEFFIKLLKK